MSCLNNIDGSCGILDLGCIACSNTIKFPDNIDKVRIKVGDMNNTIQLKGDKVINAVDLPLLREIHMTMLDDQGEIVELEGNSILRVKKVIGVGFSSITVN